MDFMARGKRALARAGRFYTLKRREREAKKAVVILNTSRSVTAEAQG